MQCCVLTKWRETMKEKRKVTSESLRTANPTLFKLIWPEIRYAWKAIVFGVIALMGRVFANGSGDQDSILGQAIPKTQKMVWFLCFYGISTFMGYLMPKHSFQKSSNDAINL